jgi:hypothetical protein
MKIFISERERERFKSLFHFFFSRFQKWAPPFFVFLFFLRFSQSSLTHSQARKRIMLCDDRRTKNAKKQSSSSLLVSSQLNYPPKEKKEEYT